MLRFLDICAKNLRNTIDVLGYENLLFKCADKFFQTGRTPLNNSSRTLPKINPLDHLDRATTLPAFFLLFKIYRNTGMGWKLAAFFVGQLFQEIAEESPQSEMLIVNMLEELLSNCSARDLTSDPKERHVEFIYLELFGEAFLKIFYEERQNNQEELKELSEKTRRNIVNEFEKENSSVLKKKMRSIFSKKRDEKEQLSGQSSSIRFWYKAYEKPNADLLFKENLTKASTPVARRTRSNIAATEVDVKGKKR